MTRASLCWLLTAGLVLACSDAGPRPAAVLRPDRPSLSRSGGGGEVLTCTPLPYDSVTQVVGPSGGTIQVGPHELWVPQGALDSAVSITAVAPSSGARMVRFAPEGLVFANSAYLLMSYASCDLPNDERWVAQVTEAQELIEYAQGFDDPYEQKVLGLLEHFSNYAVAW